MFSPLRLKTATPPFARRRVEPSLEIATSTILPGNEDFRRSCPFRFRRITCWLDAAATVGPSREMTALIPPLPVLYVQRRRPSPLEEVYITSGPAGNDTRTPAIDRYTFDPVFRLKRPGDVSDRSLLVQGEDTEAGISCRADGPSVSGESNVPDAGIRFIAPYDVSFPVKQQKMVTGGNDAFAV